MRIVWWNAYRFGASTTDDRRSGISGMLGQWDPFPDIILLCELTTQCTDPLALQYVYRRKNPFQLCYGIESGTLPAVGSQVYTPGPTNCYKQGRFKGGNDFTRITSRAPGMLTMPNGTPVYFFHAPSSNNAVKALAYLACDLNDHHGNHPWVLLGDFNVEPEKLGAQNTGVVLSDLIKEPDRPTHVGGKKLDYALSNIQGLTVTVGDSGGFSDHDPILVAA